MWVPNMVSSHLTEEICSRLREQIPVFEKTLQDRKLLRSSEEHPFGDVHRGLRVRIAKFPAIRVISNSVASEDFASRVLREKFEFFIDCMYKLVTADEPHVNEEACIVLSRTVQSYLNYIDFRQFAVTGDRAKVNVSVGTSFADNLDFGYSESGTLRIGRIHYTVELFPTYMP